jgi:gliding-associated putative ABC transporter substrate-binding component GldG
MKTEHDRNKSKFSRLFRFLQLISGVIIIASAGSLINLRVDLTEDHRYTLSPQTKKILSGLRNDIFIQVFLDGDMPIPMKRLRRSVKETLDEFKIISRRKVDYEFINPSEGNQQQRNAKYNSLIEKGINPVNIQAGDAEGGRITKLIFPGMLINYNETEVPVNFLRNNTNVSYDQNILNSIEGLEYELIQTISTLSSDTIRKVAFLEGQKEMPEPEVASVTLSLAKFFTVDRGSIGGKQGILDRYSAVIIAGPEDQFSEADKLVLDQYIMKGGKVLWLAEETRINTDSLTTGETVALYQPLNLEDQLFRYGARINPAIVQDIECAPIRLSVRTGAGNSQVILLPWMYYPLLKPSPSHPITRNLNRIRGEYPNYLDTVGLNPAIRKTILLETSSHTRILNPPLIIRLKEAENIPDESTFNRSRLPVAVLLEGVFPSAFRNRMISGIVKDKSFRITTESVPTKMIIIADADIIRNEVKRTGVAETPYPLGQDRMSGITYGNSDFIVNCLNYLVDEKGIMELRSREIKLRLLDRNRIRNEKTEWQIINIFGPILLVVAAGFIYSWFRRKTYTQIKL